MSMQVVLLVGNVVQALQILLHSATVQLLKVPMHSIKHGQNIAKVAYSATQMYLYTVKAFTLWVDAQMFAADPG